MQRPGDNRGGSTSTSDSSEARDPIAHKNDPGSDSSEAPAKPPSKCPRKRQREHTPSTSSSERHSSRKRHCRHYSSSSSSSSSSSPETSSRSFSGCYSHRRKHKRRHSHRRKHKCHHHRSRRYSLGNYYPGSITCAPPLPRSLQNHIRRGKFVMFDKLLIPQNEPPTPNVGKGNAKRSKWHMLLTYLHGSRHETDTYTLGLPTTFPWLSSSSSIRQSW